MKLTELYVLREDLRAECEDNWPEGLMPKKHAEYMLKRHKYTWQQYAQEAGLPPQMPEMVEYQPLLDWMGY